jgi:hypothetical protein
MGRSLALVAPVAARKALDGHVRLDCPSRNSIQNLRPGPQTRMKHIRNHCHSPLGRGLRVSPLEAAWHCWR